MSPMLDDKEQDIKGSLFLISDSQCDRGSREGTPDFASHSDGVPKSSVLTPSQFKVTQSLFN